MSEPMITKSEIDTLQELLSAATPGPLTDDRGDGSMGTVATVADDIQIAQLQSLGIRPAERDHAQRKANARYLVALWNCAPRLFSTINTLERLLNETNR